MCQGRGAYPCSTPVHDVLWGIVNFTFHLHRLLFLVRHLHPKDSEVRATKIQCNEISFLYVENKTQVIKNHMQHKSGKHQAWLSAALKQRSSPYSASCRASTWIWFHWSDSLQFSRKLVQWQCQAPLIHRQLQWRFTQKELKALDSLYPDLMMRMAEQSSQERPKRDVERRHSRMKGCQTTDKQPFAVNKPVSFWQVTVDGGCSKINKSHTDVMKVGITPHPVSRKAEIHCKLQTDKRSQRKDSLKNHPCTAAGVTQKLWCLAQSS